MGAFVTSVSDLYCPISDVFLCSCIATNCQSTGVHNVLLRKSKCSMQALDIAV